MESPLGTVAPRLPALSLGSVDFVQAPELWQDPMRIEVPVRTTGEPRWLVVGQMGGKHWSAVVTYREDRVGIISVRRARDEEVRIYEV